VRPLRPATDHRLGRPLPCQLANRPQPPPPATLAGLCSPLLVQQGCYAVLAQVSPGYSPPEGRLATCYSPGRHFTHGVAPAFSSDLHVLGTPPALILSQDQTLVCSLAHAPIAKFCRKPCGPQPGASPDALNALNSLALRRGGICPTTRAGQVAQRPNRICDDSVRLTWLAQLNCQRAF
jgi:hypothetical protein